MRRVRNCFLLLMLVFLLSGITVQAALPVVRTDVTTASEDCVLLGIEGTYVVQAQAALNRINEIRLEACRQGIKDPATGNRLSEDSYVPLRWSYDMEYIARIRAAEAALTMNHTRTNGEICFGLASPNNIGSYSEVLAWNHSDTMLQGIEQWYGEKSDYVNGYTSAETGHYEAMINPTYLYVGLGTFLSDSPLYHNCTAGEFSGRPGLSERTMSNPGRCVQAVEVSRTALNHKLIVTGTLSGKAGDNTELQVTTGVKMTNYWNTPVESKGLYLLGGLSWTSSNLSIVSVGAAGLGAAVKANGCGGAQITVKYAPTGDSSSVTYSVLHKEAADAAVPATCVKTGLTAGTHCPVCGTVLKAQTVVPVTAHQWDEGTVTREATAIQHGILTQECKVCHEKKNLTIEKLKPTYKVNTNLLILKKGQLTKKLVVSGLAKGDYIVLWACRDRAVAAVNQLGWVKGLKVGNTIIGAKLASGKWVYVAVKVQAKAVATTAIKGLPKSLKLAKGRKTQLRPVLYPITSVEKVTYKSSNRKIVRVYANGVIQALKAGKATITVRAGKKKFNVVVTVPKTKTVKILNVPSSLVLKKGKSLQLKPRTYPVDSDDGLKYKSSNTGVVKVSAKGKLTARKPGKAVIYVTSGKVTVRCVVQVI